MTFAKKGKNDLVKYLLGYHLWFHSSHCMIGKRQPEVPTCGNDDLSQIGAILYICTCSHTFLHIKNIKPKVFENIWLNVCMAKYVANFTFCRNYWLSQRKYVFNSSAILPEEAQALWSVLSQHSDKIYTWGICSKKVSAMYLSIDRSLFLGSLFLESRYLPFPSTPKNCGL